MFIILYDVAYFSKNKMQLLTVSRLTIWILFIIILEVFGVFLVIVLEISIYRRYSGNIYSENMYFGLPIDLKSFLKSRLDFMCLFVCLFTIQIQILFKFFFHHISESILFDVQYNGQHGIRVHSERVCVGLSSQRWLSKLLVWASRITWLCDEKLLPWQWPLQPRVKD